MTTDFVDPNEDEELSQLMETDMPESEVDELDIEPPSDAEDIAVLEEIIEPSTFDTVDPPGELEQLVQGGDLQEHLSREPFGLHREHPPAAPTGTRPVSPPARGEISLPLGRPGKGEIQTLPGVQNPAAEGIELFSTQSGVVPQQPPEIAPVVVRHLPPQRDGAKADPGSDGRERLRIEVEITLANAERISRIAVDAAQAEFKKLASQATQRLDEKFYEYRANQRLLRRG